MGLPLKDNAPTDFDFALGSWQVKHRRLKERLSACDEWVEFDGRMFTQKVLGGFGNIEDNILLLPEGEYRAIAIRSFDQTRSEWSIWWLDGRSPTQLDVPVKGGFSNGIGTFYANDTLRGNPIVVRFLWVAQNPERPRWEQAFSEDGGQNWETNWTMDFSPA